MTAPPASFLATGRGRFVSVFFFLTLYMQNILGYSPIRGGAAYLPVTAGISSKLSVHTGTRPVIAAARTSTLLAARAPTATALTGGYQRASLACAIFLLAPAVIALHATNTRGEPAAHPDEIRAGHDRIPAPELTD